MASDPDLDALLRLASHLVIGILALILTWSTPTRNRAGKVFRLLFAAVATTAIGAFVAIIWVGANAYYYLEWAMLIKLVTMMLCLVFYSVMQLPPPGGEGRRSGEI